MGGMLQPTDIGPRKQGRLADDAGLSFIDLMLSMVVLTIGVLAMADLQVIASRSNNSSRNTSAALNVATTKMEALKDTVFTSIVSEAATTVTVLDPPRPPLTFTRQVTVAIDTPIAGSKTVTVIVSWTDSAKKTHSIPMATVIAAPL
jgi:Tfp pilus assembly protein PilX